MENKKEISTIIYSKQCEIIPTKNGCMGCSQQDVVFIEKKEIIDGKEVTTTSLYSIDGQEIGHANEDGIIVFNEEYLSQLKEQLGNEIYTQLSLENRAISIDEVLANNEFVELPEEKESEMLAALIDGEKNTEEKKPDENTEKEEEIQQTPDPINADEEELKAPISEAIGVEPKDILSVETVVDRKASEIIQSKDGGGTARKVTLQDGSIIFVTCSQDGEYIPVNNSPVEENNGYTNYINDEGKAEKCPVLSRTYGDNPNEAVSTIKTSSGIVSVVERIEDNNGSTASISREVVTNGNNSRHTNENVQNLVDNAPKEEIIELNNEIEKSRQNPESVIDTGELEDEGRTPWGDAEERAERKQY